MLGDNSAHATKQLILSAVRGLGAPTNAETKEKKMFIVRFAAVSGRVLTASLTNKMR